MKNLKNLIGAGLIGLGSLGVFGNEGYGQENWPPIDYMDFKSEKEMLKNFFYLSINFDKPTFNIKDKEIYCSKYGTSFYEKKVNKIATFNKKGKLIYAGEVLIDNDGKYGKAYKKGFRNRYLRKNKKGYVFVLENKNPLEFEIYHCRNKPYNEIIKLQE